MEAVGSYKKYSFLFGLNVLILLLLSVSINRAYSQCPESNNNVFDYISIDSNGEVSDWNNASIWKTTSWVNPKSPPGSGKIKRSIAINGNVVLNNPGLSIEFNQPSKICGSLTVAGKVIVSGGCSPLNVYGKLIVHGDLETNQSILVWPGGELIVYGDWKVKGGSYPVVMGKMAVKGSVECKYELNITTGGLFVTFGSFTARNGFGPINGDCIVTGDITIPSWSFKTGVGDIYCLGSDSSIGGYQYLSKEDLQNNPRLNSEYVKYRNLFWPVPSKYIDLNVISKNILQEYTAGGCVIDTTLKYKVSNRNRIYLQSEPKDKFITIKFDRPEKNNLKVILDDAFQVDEVYYSINGENRILDKLFYDRGNRLLTIYLEGNAVNDLKIRGLQGILKIEGQGIELEGISKDEVKSLSVFALADRSKPVFMAVESTGWNGKDQIGNELASGVYLLLVELKNGESISGQFIVK